MTITRAKANSMQHMPQQIQQQKPQQRALVSSHQPQQPATTYNCRVLLENRWERCRIPQNRPWKQVHSAAFSTTHATAYTTAYATANSIRRIKIYTAIIKYHILQKIPRQKPLQRALVASQQTQHTANNLFHISFHKTQRETCHIKTPRFL
jgi:hypothetical protein